MITFGEIINDELTRLNKTIGASEVARILKTDKTSTWRYLNRTSKIPFEFIVKLEKAELIKPFPIYFKRLTQ